MPFKISLAPSVGDLGLLRDSTIVFELNLFRCSKPKIADVGARRPSDWSLVRILKMFLFHHQ